VWNDRHQLRRAYCAGGWMTLSDVHSNVLVKEFRRQVCPIRPDDGVKIWVQHERSKNGLVTKGLENFSFKFRIKVDLACQSIAKLQPNYVS